jgi:hypothetical protein
MNKFRRTSSAILCLFPLLLESCAATQSKSDCASAEATSTETCAAAAGEAPVFRYIASVEGDYNSGYQPDRTVAESKLRRWEGKVPESAP